MPEPLCFDVRPFVSQPLALEALKRFLRAFLIVHTIGDAVVIAEVEFCKITVQVLLGTVPVNTLHAALED